ncbi:hypothetical protein Q1695_002362 [Nippostrongylus brasiliensis]|nr:hypothetical protein Q1695_002362 [Nippostrongylus brasiliensis]
MGLASNRYRFVVLAIGLMCLTSICSNYIIINFTFICMKDDLSELRQSENGTVRGLYDYTQSERSTIIWAVAVGTIVGTFPINYLYVAYGAKYPFLCAGILSIISTIFIPSCAKSGLPFLIFARFLQGLAYSADFAAIGLICVRWAPLSEMAIYIALLTSFTPVSAIVTNAITGFLCTSPFGWKSSFYLHAGFGVVCFTLWVIFYTDEPENCRAVSKKEIRLIQKDKSAEHIEHKKDVPYKAILSSPVILCVWFNAFCEMTFIILLSTYSPIYFRAIFGFGLEVTGLLVSLTTIAQLPFKLTAGFLSDRITFFTETTKMKFFNTVSVGLVGVMFCYVGFIPVEYKWVAVATFAMIHSFSSWNCGGFYKCGTFVARLFRLVCRQHAHIVIATIQFMKCVALFAAPALVDFVVHDDSNKMQWATVFAIAGVVMIVANLMAYPLFTDQPATWTTSKKIDEEGTSMDHLNHNR